MLQRELNRYAAYFRGWCQAFGEHDVIAGEEDGISWLLTDRQAGFVLPQALLKPLYREVLLHSEAPTLSISRDHVEIGSLNMALTRSNDHRVLNTIEQILETGNDYHLFLTSHLFYGTGARIITISSKKPVAIIYKQIGTMRIQLL